MWILGVDENGMGPQFGPLVATAVAIEPDHYDPAVWRARGERLGITDSKQSSGAGRMARAESFALALVERVFGEAPATADALLDRLVSAGAAGLRASCGCRSASAPAVDQCFGVDVRLPAFGGDVDEGRRWLRALEAEAPLRVRWGRSDLACAARLNRALEEGRNKLRVDLGLFEGLVLAARAHAGADLRAICGMVGGIRDYTKYLGRLAAVPARTTGTDRRRRRYVVEMVGEVAFEVKADAAHLPVAMASMVGKYVRELEVERINRFYRAYLPHLPRASGYHDPVSDRFVRETAGVRERLGVPPECFLRR